MPCETADSGILCVNAMQSSQYHAVPNPKRAHGHMEIYHPGFYRYLPISCATSLVFNFPARAIKAIALVINKGSLDFPFLPQTGTWFISVQGFPSSGIKSGSVNRIAAMISNHTRVKTLLESGNAQILAVFLIPGRKHVEGRGRRLCVCNIA